MWFLAGVCATVDSAVSSARESPAADFALVRFLAGVYAGVRGPVSFAGEFLAAKLALVRFFGVSANVVSTHVLGQQRYALVADFTE